MNLCVKRLGPVAGLILLLSACTGARQSNVLAIFFDGVPGKNPAVAAPVAPVPAQAAESNPAVPELYLLARAAPPGVRHKPYADRECISCHESQFSQKLRGEVAEICQLCHKNTFASRPFLHTPVATGRCLECHKPHESRESALLALPERQLCAKCHEEKHVLGTSAHAKIGDAACHVCHDPHGGQQKFYLTGSAPDRPVAPLARRPSQ